MSWYSIFYWVAVAEGIKDVSKTLAIILGILVLFLSICYVTASGHQSEQVSNKNEKEANAWAVWSRMWKRLLWTATPLFIIFISLWMFVPSKRDFAVIIAGGAVAEFATSDTAAKQIPSEVLGLVRDKIKELRAESVGAFDAQLDSLKDKSKEELLQIIKNNKP